VALASGSRPDAIGSLPGLIGHLIGFWGEAMGIPPGLGAAEPETEPAAEVAPVGPLRGCSRAQAARAQAPGRARADA
jgi:hypothetical protein